MKVKDKIDRLRKRYKYVSKHRYFYNDPKELKAKGNHIVCWLLVNTRKRGVFVMRFVFKKAEPLTVEQWSKHWTSRHKGHMDLLNILTVYVLPNISHSFRRGDDWQLVDLIGWTLEKK